MKNHRIQYDGRNLRVLVVSQPRATFIMNGHETVFARDDDSIRFKSRETIVVCSGSMFDKESLWAVRPWMSRETWEGYAIRPIL